MKALVYTGPETLAYQNAPDPATATDERLLDVRSVGICGSDMHAFLGHDDRRPAPLILGHEVAAIDATGRRFALNPLVTCGVCDMCLAGADNLCRTRQIISMPPREGGFAERLAMPTRNLTPAPQHLTDDQIALAEPIACGWHAARIGLAIVGDRRRAATVFGGGAIGLGAALALEAKGVEQVTIVEPNAARRAFIDARCGKRIVDVGSTEALSEVDLVVDGVGLDASRAQASGIVRPGGAIVHIGLGGGSGGLDVRRFTLQEISFVGTYTYTSQDFRETVAAMADGRLGALDWFETRALADGEAAFADIRSGRVAAPKIILKP